MGDRMRGRCLSWFLITLAAAACSSSSGGARATGGDGGLAGAGGQAGGIAGASGAGGSVATAGNGGGSAGAGGSGVDGGQQCQPYPVPATDGAGDESAARAALASIDPTAQLTWNASRGTLADITGAIPLASCVAGQDVHDSILALVKAYPTLFNIDVSEWARADNPLPCDSVSDVNRYVTFGRVRFGNHLSQSSGFLTVGVHAVSGQVILFRVQGDFTPATTLALASLLGACEGSVATTADVFNAATSMSFTYLFGTYCNLSNTGTYRPSVPDVVMLRDDSVYHSGIWTRLSSGPDLSYVRKAWLIIDPANYTSDLTASNANCGTSIGFELTIDAVSGQIISYLPGLGCTVC
jgi:hypothetical protein